MPRTSLTAKWYSSAEADWQQWIDAVSDVLRAVLTQTADTGQIDPLAYPTKPAVSTYAGYEVFRFDDTLQATKPVFLKVEYGISGVSAQPQMRVTLGTTTDGAGNLGGRTAQLVLGSANTANPKTFFACHKDSLLTFGAGMDPNGGASADSDVCWMVVERTRNADGTPNGDGIWYFSTRANIATYPGVGVIMTYDGVVGADPPVSYDIPAAVPNLHTGTVASALKGDTAYAFPLIPHTVYPQAPSAAAMAIFRTDFPRVAPVTITHFGQSMEFMSLGSAAAISKATQSSGGSGVLNTNCSLLLRWEV